MTQIRQGDILLRRIEERPPASARVKTASARIVVAEGEKTGHAHAVIGDDVELYERDGTLYVSVGDGARLEHEEHATIALAPGTYEVVRQREYAPGPASLWRGVKD